MKTLFAFLLIWPALAGAQISYTTPADAALKPLDGATVAGKIHVQLVQTTGAPWTLCLDGKCNTENTAPYVLANESGDTSDTNVIDTTKFADGAHVATAKNATTSVTASFSIANAATAPTPSPPSNPQPGGTGTTVTVGWNAPKTYTDNTPITDLSGFLIYFGTDPAALGTAIKISNPTATSGTVGPLGDGTWYFAVTALTSAGAESQQSQVVSHVISGTGGTGTGPGTPPPPPPPPPEVWIVAKNGTNTTRPVYEAVLPLTGTTLVRGNQEGTAAVTTVKCGPELFVLSKNSYRAIADADVTLTSPTYKGRQHVAICTRQQ